MKGTTASNSVTRMPRQAIPVSQKTKAWKEQSVEAVIAMSEFGGLNKGLGWSDEDHNNLLADGLSRKELIARCYQYYNGTILDDDYSHVLKPYGKSRGNFPAKLQNYNIVAPSVNLLKGEYIKRPDNASVTVLNDDVVNRKLEEKKKVMKELLQQMFVNELAQQGVVGEENAAEVPNPSQVEQKFESSYRDQRAIQGQNALNFIRQDQELDDEKFLDGWTDFLIAGEVYSHKKIVEGNVIYEILNPLHVDYDKSPNVTYVEDGDWAVNYRLLTVSDVIDEFNKFLSEDEIVALEEETIRRGSSTLYYSDVNLTDRNTTRDNLVEVVDVYWKSKRRVGIATRSLPTGEELEYEVADGYTAQEDETIDWYWQNEVWQGTRIDENIYVDIKPLPIQRQDLSNKSECKLPINGRKVNDRNAPNMSLIMMLLPYQLVYNIYLYRLENKVAKAKDLIALLDINMIPDGPEFGQGEEKIDKWFYYMDAIGIAFVDYSKEGLPANHQFVMDLTAKELDAYMNLIRFVLEQIENLTGITRQRLGSISQFDLKGTVEQSIIQSSNITEDYFNKYAKFVQRDLQGLLDYSKAAWIDGKSLSYVTKDGAQALLAIDGLQHLEADYGIVVNNTAKEQQRLNDAKGLIQPMVQNGAPISSVVEIINADNFAELRQKLKEAEEAAQAAQEAQMQMEMQARQQEQEMKMLEMQNENEQNERDRKNKIQVAQIQANAQIEARAMDNDDNDNGIADANEFLNKRVEDERRLALDRAKLSQKDKIDTGKLKLEQKKHADKMVIEKKKLAKPTPKPSGSK